VGLSAIFSGHIAVGQAIGSPHGDVLREDAARLILHGAIEDDQKEAHTRIDAAKFNQRGRLARACTYGGSDYYPIHFSAYQAVMQCCGSGSARIQKFYLSGSGSGSEIT